MICFQKIILKKIWQLGVLLLLQGAFLGAVSAHTGGFSIEKEVGDYLLDVGYNPEILVENSQVRFDFAIYNNISGQEISFSEVWVRIENSDRLLFAGGLNKARFGATGLSYSFPEAGNYTLSVRFSGATSTLAEDEFIFNVTEVDLGLSEQVWFMPVLYTSLVWFGLMLFVAISIYKLNKRQSSNEKLVSTNSSGVKPVIKIITNLCLFLSLIVMGYLLAALLSPKIRILLG